MTVGCVYRPPSTPTEFWSALENVTEEIQGRSIILLGDLNVNSIDRSDSQYKHFSSLCLSLQLQEIVQRPTRVTEKSAKCIDLILTNTSYLMNPTVTHVDFTDHCLGASSLQCVDREFPASKTWTHCRRRGPTNISDSRLSDALQKQMNLLGTMNGLDNMWSDWKDKFTKALDEVAPKVTTVHRRRQRCPWMTPRLLNLIHKQKSLYRKVLKSNKQDQQLLTAPAGLCQNDVSAWETSFWHKPAGAVRSCCNNEFPARSIAETRSSCHEESPPSSKPHLKYVQMSQKRIFSKQNLWISELS